MNVLRLAFAIVSTLFKMLLCFRNPLGEDDDDFSVNYLLDRIHFVSFKIVDELAKQVCFFCCSIGEDDNEYDEHVLMFQISVFLFRRT